MLKASRGDCPLPTFKPITYPTRPDRLQSWGWNTARSCVPPSRSLTPPLVSWPMSVACWVFWKYKSDLCHPTLCPRSTQVRKRDRKSFLSLGVLGLGSFMDALEPRTLDLQTCSKAIPLSSPAHSLPHEVGQASDLCSLHTRVACAADSSHPSFIHLSTKF